MTLDDLLAHYKDKPIAIYTGEEYYADCLAWLHSQGLKWPGGNSLNDEAFYPNKATFYKEDQCIVIDPKKFIYSTSYKLIEGIECHFVKYEELFQQQHIDFADLDAIL